MVKHSKIVPTRDVNRFTKSLIDLVTGNPTIEEPSPIKKRKDPLIVRSPKKAPPKFPSIKSDPAI